LLTAASDENGRIERKKGKTAAQNPSKSRFGQGKPPLVKSYVFCVEKHCFLSLSRMFRVGKGSVWAGKAVASASLPRFFTLFSSISNVRISLFTCYSDANVFSSSFFVADSSFGPKEAILRR